jgi:hypothetical protein
MNAHISIEVLMVQHPRYTRTHSCMLAKLQFEQLTLYQERRFSATWAYVAEKDPYSLKPWPTAVPRSLLLAIITMHPRPRDLYRCHQVNEGPPSSILWCTWNIVAQVMIIMGVVHNLMCRCPVHLSQKVGNYDCACQCHSLQLLTPITFEKDTYSVSKTANQMIGCVRLHTWPQTIHSIYGKTF